MTETSTPGKTSQTVVIGGNYWGSGSDLASAKLRFTREGGRLSNGYVILTFDEETEFLGVNDMGYFSFRRTDGKDEAPHQPTAQTIAPRNHRRR